MTTINLDGKVEGAILITYGDTDGDGKQGIRVRIWADTPFDGTEEPKPVLDLGEMERVPQVDVPDKLADVLKVIGPVAKGIMDLKKKLLG
jgi:hypothetical protein